MADNKTNIGTPDKERVNLSEDYEVQYWAHKFNVTAEKLKKAVRKVGDSAKNIEEYLKKSK